MLLLLVGFPMLVFVIMLGIAAVRPAKSSYDLMQEREALWVGGAKAVGPGASAQGRVAGSSSARVEAGGSGEQAAVEAAEAQRAEGGPADRGGASARW
jgi:hypothetical protein